jgi:hypothetical protein
LSNLRKLVRQALVESGRTQSAFVFPTVLATWPEEALKRRAGATLADAAIAYLTQCGFRSDRTRQNLHGYPGLIRELNEPPPWVEVNFEDVEGSICAARHEELRPLYLQAIEESEHSLRVRFEEYLTAMCNVLKTLYCIAIQFLLLGFTRF